MPIDFCEPQSEEPNVKTDGAAVKLTLDIGMIEREIVDFRI
jgi:hypothetical protein